MNLQILFLLVLRVHLVILAVQRGVLFELDDRILATPPMTWFSEEVSSAGTASDMREEALCLDISVSPNAAHAL